MRRAHLAGAALLALTLAPPARAQDRNKDPKKPAQVLEASKVLRPGDVVGKLLRSSGNTFTLRLEFDTVELKPGARASSANRQQQNLINQQQKLARLQQQLATA